MKWISQEIIILDATDFDVLNEKARVLLEEQRRLKDIESKRSKIPESEAHIAGVSTRQFRKTRGQAKKARNVFENDEKKY